MTATILAVDDSNTIRKMIEITLKSKGYNAILACDGLEGLEALERHSIDLVILDINMPRLDGLSMLSQLRQRAEWANLPVLVLTTEDQDSDRQRAMEQGATDYLPKPFKPAQLLERVAALLGTA